MWLWSGNGCGQDHTKSVSLDESVNVESHRSNTRRLVISAGGERADYIFPTAALRQHFAVGVQHTPQPLPIAITTPSLVLHVCVRVCVCQGRVRAICAGWDFTAVRVAGVSQSGHK